MNSFYNLPTELQTYIYEFDSTYHRKFEGVLDKISLLNAHRYFYYDKDKHLCCFEIIPKNIDMFLDNYFSFMSKRERSFFRGELMDYYNIVQLNIIEDDKCEEYLFDIEKEFTFKRPITKIGVKWTDIPAIHNLFLVHN